MRLQQRTLPFAVVALVLIVGCPVPAAGPRPFIVVGASYPGANAEVVADTVAAPIEQQVNGLENLVYLRSRSTSDGRCALQAVLAQGTDLNIAQVLVQNRVALALPQIPEAVQQLGMTVVKGPAGVLAFVTLSSPDGRYDLLYLSNYATIQIKDELGRLAGVAGVTSLGRRDYGMRVRLDPDRLAAYNLGASDVVRALKDQNVAVLGGQGPQEAKRPLAVTALGRLTTPEQFADIILKTTATGQTVRLKDVARVELGAGSPHGEARFDGKPVVLLAVAYLPGARPREVSAALRDRVAALRKLLPDGLDLSVPFDFTPNLEAPRGRQTPGYLLVDATLPAGASLERTVKVLERCTDVLRRIHGVAHTLALTKNPFDLASDQPCVLVGLDPAERERTGPVVAARARRDLRVIDDALTRVRDLSGPDRFPRCGYPIDFAVRGPETARVRELADRLAQRLQQTSGLTEVWADAASAPQPQLYLDIDRTQAAQLGVSLNDISNTLQVYMGSAYVNSFNRFGRTWQVSVQDDGGGRKRAADIKRLQVRSDKGKMVPLGSFVTVRDITAPRVIDRLDLEPMVEVTANPASGVTLGQARGLCEAAANEELSAGYRLVWLQELPAAEPAPAGPKGTGAAPAVPPDPPVVPVSRPAEREVTDHEDFPGRTQAVQTVDVRARVTGYLVAAPFKEGGTVKRGDVLFEIDPRPYQAQLDQAMSQIVVHEAALRLAKAVLARDRRLASTAPGAITQQQLDQDTAAVEEAQARVKAAQASTEICKVNLSFTRVTSPMDGRIGRRLMDPGNLVKADETLLATIVSQDPMHVYFDVDERTLLRLRRLHREKKAPTPADARMPVLLALADEQDYTHQGVIDFADNQLDPNTGTLRVRAVFPNHDGLLSPGLFMHIRVPIGGPRKALLVPDRALGNDQGLKFVYVVDAQDKVEYRRVTVGPLQEDGLRVIEAGLRPGERVIVGGLQRVRPRMMVKAQEVPIPTVVPAPRR